MKKIYLLPATAITALFVSANSAEARNDQDYKEALEGAIQVVEQKKNEACRQAAQMENQPASIKADPDFKRTYASYKSLCERRTQIVQTLRSETRQNQIDNLKMIGNLPHSLG